MFVLSTSSSRKEALEDVTIGRISASGAAAIGMIVTTATTGAMQAQEMGAEMPEIQGMDRIATTEVMDRILKSHQR